MLLNGTVEDRLHSTQFRIEELKFVWRVDKQISHFSFWNVEFMSDHCRYFDQSVLYSYLLNFSSTKIIHFWVPWMESTVMNCVLVIFFSSQACTIFIFSIKLYLAVFANFEDSFFFLFFFFVSEFIKNLFTYLFLFFISSKNKMPKSFFVFFLYIFSSFQICWCVYNAYIWNIFLISLLSLWLYFSSVQ